MREREIKLLIGPDVHLPPAPKLFAGLGEWSVDEIEQHAVYFDTCDLALTRAGASLRYRSDDGWTVKLPRSRNGSSFEREEYEFAGESGQPPLAAVDLVRACIRSRTLFEVAEIHTKRRRIRLRDRRGEPVLEVDEDDVATSARREPSTGFKEVEIETTGDADPHLVDTLVERLRTAGADGNDAQPKITRALGERATAPPDVVPPGRIDDTTTVEQFARASLTKSVQQLLEHDPLVRLGEDPEGVHRARTATRRLRSDLRTFRPLLDPGWSEALRAELGWLGELLGRVRDADVLLQRLTVMSQGLTAKEHSTANELIKLLREMRGRDRVVLLDALRSERYIALLDRLVDGIRAPNLCDNTSSGRASKTVRSLARHEAKRLRRQVRRLSPLPEDTDLHEVRKRAKQARYAFEAIAPVAGRRATRAAKALADLQGLLGEHQDCVVGAAWLRDAAVDSDRTEIAFIAGRLAGTFDADKKLLRREWPTSWKRAKRLLDRVSSGASR